jgi:hypothetical protein
VALLMSGRMVVSYDLETNEYVQQLQDIAPQRDFRIGDSREVTIIPTDMLFIDTLHTGEQLETELERHHDKVMRYIVLHDTTTFAMRGEIK